MSIFPQNPKHPAWAALALALLIAALIAPSSCEPPPAPDADGTATTMTFIGYVTDVRARSLVELESIRVTNAAGDSLLFRAPEGARFPDFAPSHIREHMLLGEPVRVTYRESPDGTPLILDLADYPSETPAPSE